METAREGNRLKYYRRKNFNLDRALHYKIIHKLLLYTFDIYLLTTLFSNTFELILRTLLNYYDREKRTCREMKYFFPFFA